MKNIYTDFTNSDVSLSMSSDKYSKLSIINKAEKILDRK